jgi:hypothetical protein
MSDMNQLIREDARLIVLKALAEQPDERLNSSVLGQCLEAFGGITKSRDWLHSEMDWLADIGAITQTTVNSVRIAQLTEKGASHVERRIIIEGIKRPSRAGA